MLHESREPLEELGYGGGGVIELAGPLYGGGSILSVGIKFPVQTSDKLSGVLLLDSG